MAQEFGKVQWVLERQVRDFKEELKEQVYTIFSNVKTKIIWILTSKHERLIIAHQRIEIQAIPGYRPWLSLEELVY